MTGSLRVEISELSKLAGLLDTTHDQLLASAGAQAAGAQVGNAKVADALNEFYTNWDYRRRGLAERLGVLGTLLFKAADIYAENERMLKQGFAPQTGEGDGRNDPKPVKGNEPWTGATVRKATSYQALLPVNPEPSEVVQGQIGDCYLAAGVAAIAATPGGARLLQSMIHLREDNKFEVTFADGSVEVVDGDLYVDPKGRLEGGGASDVTANWYSILEKAYAQRHAGGYDAIVGGHASDVFAELIPPGFCQDALAVGPSTATNEIWNRIHDAVREGRPACVSITGSTFPEVLEKGEGHELSVLGTYEQGGAQYVVLRNPWGELDARASRRLDTFTAALAGHHAKIPPPPPIVSDRGTFSISVKDLQSIIELVETGGPIGNQQGTVNM